MCQQLIIVNYISNVYDELRLDTNLRVWNQHKSNYIIIIHLSKIKI